MYGLATSALRRLWAAIACRSAGNVFLAAYAALDACLKAHSYGPRVGDTAAYNCRKITGGTGLSLHAFGPGSLFKFWNGIRIATALALDLNWSTNPYQYPSQWQTHGVKTDMPTAMITAIKRIRTRNGKQVWRWGGDYQTNKDTMHFEIVCSPEDLATGIDPATLPGASSWVPPVYHGVLTPGVRGEWVREWALTLQTLGYRRFYVQGPSGAIYGAGKVNATKRFQRNHGLVVDGIVGPKTHAKAVEVLRNERRKAGLPV